MPDFTTFEFPDWAYNDSFKTFIVFFVFTSIVLISWAMITWFRKSSED